MRLTLTTLGQWDYTTPDKKSYIDGCPQGNCIRSHGRWCTSTAFVVICVADPVLFPTTLVNLTETSYALSMSELAPFPVRARNKQRRENVADVPLPIVTKAGVASHLIYVGESSYGRSFKLAEPGCKGPMCQFLGTRLESPAKKGRCTDVSGYISNAEIQEIVGSLSDDADTGIKGEAWHDGASNSDMLLYDGTSSPLPGIPLRHCPSFPSKPRAQGSHETLY
jgi:hypothetical protein